MKIEVSGKSYELDLIPYLASTEEMIAFPASLVGLMLCASQSDRASWIAVLINAVDPPSIPIENKTP